MLPIRRGDGAGLSAKGFSEVRKGDGTVLWSAGSDIPDSEANQKLIHRWILDDVNGTVADSVGTADGTNNGVTSVFGNWAGGSAGVGDGSTSYIDVGTLGTFGSEMDTDFAIALSFQLPQTSNLVVPFGVFSGSGNQYLYLSLGPISDVAAGEIALQMGDENYNQTRVYQDGVRYDDNNKYRIVFNKTANSASGIELYINQTSQPLTVNVDEGFVSGGDFLDNVYLFARNGTGTADLHWPNIIDDICVFGDSLTQTEAESYANPWS